MRGAFDGDQCGTCLSREWKLKLKMRRVTSAEVA
jgi:hypothetical protein